MNFDELRELINLLEKEQPDMKCRLSCPLDDRLLDRLRKTYLIVAEDTSWGCELIVAEKM